MGDEETFAVPLEFKLLEREEPEVDSTTHSGIRRGRIKEDHDQPPKWISTWIPWDAGMDVNLFLRNLKRELAAVGLATAKDVEDSLRARIAEYAIMYGPASATLKPPMPPASAVPHHQISHQQPPRHSQYPQMTPGIPNQQPAPYYKPVPFTIPPTPGVALQIPSAPAHHPHSSSSSAYTMPVYGASHSYSSNANPGSESGSKRSSKRSSKRNRIADDENEDLPDESGVNGAEEDDDDEIYIPQKNHSKTSRANVRTRSSEPGLHASPSEVMNSQMMTPAPNTEKKRRPTKICPQCNAAVGVTTRICPQCSAEFFSPKAPDSASGKLVLGKGRKSCKNCGAVIASSRKECPECHVMCTRD